MFEITTMHGTFNHRDAPRPNDMLEEHMVFFPGQSVLVDFRVLIVQALLNDGTAILAGMARPVPVARLRAID